MTDKAPVFTAHWTSALSGNRRSISLKTKAEGIAECKALFREGAKNIRLTEFRQTIGGIDINWRKP